MDKDKKGKNKTKQRKGFILVNNKIGKRMKRVHDIFCGAPIFTVQIIRTVYQIVLCSRKVGWKGKSRNGGRAKTETAKIP